VASLVGVGSLTTFVLQLIGADEVAIVSTATVKQFIQVDYAVEDDALELMIDAAQEFLEGYLGVKFHESEIVETTEDLDGGTNALRPTYHPINSVTSVTDRESSSAESSGNYRFNNYRVFYKDQCYTWACGDSRWRVVYKAGYLEASTPSPIKMALCMIVARVFNNRTQNRSEGVSGLKTTYMSGSEGFLEAANNLDILQPYRFALSV